MSEDSRKINQLAEDVTEIKAALLGNEKFRQKGALQRLDEVEARSWSNKHRIDKIWFYAVGAGAVLWAVFQGLQMMIGR